MTNTVLKNVVAFVGIVFLLLGVLFGTQIITFMFGNLGAASSDLFSDETNTRTNLTDVFINATVFTIPQASDLSFTGGFTVLEVINVSNDVVLLSGNYTVDADAGTITNATALVFSDVNMTYTWTAKTDAEIATETANNNSIQSIITYTSQASTQLNTAAIAITLLILIALFVVFWVSFIKPLMGDNSSTKGGTFAT